MDPYLPVVESYATFAEEAADSPCFVEWAHGVVGDPEVQRLIGTLPPVKQQPNLVFAAARWRHAPAPAPYAAFREALLDRWDQVRATILERSTQTNEVGRLATLVPAFASFPSPLALVEVGTSAGLCLYPDRYAYRWLHEGTEERAGAGPELVCRVSGAAPLPDAVPEVGWRGGIDLHPLDVTDADAMAWLENLVWPEQDARRERLRSAIEVARRDPPHVVRGDLVESLPELLAGVAAGLTPVVFHSAVIAYLEEPDRRRFAELMRGLVAEGRCHWVSNEAPNVLPEVTGTGPEPSRPGFVLGIDGRSVAFTHGHGATLDWHRATD